ncbi:fasciclin domain-containing protein [Viscerimonas tarda]
MKNKCLIWLSGCLLLICGIFSSCKDEYIFDNESPDWLGESIYQYLDQTGNFTYYVRMIDALEYTEVLSKTGSKTLFVADDEAFNRFFQNRNPWGVTRFEDLTKAQMKLILNSSMINNAYLIDMLSSTEGPIVGQALRRATALSALDSVPFEFGRNIPPTAYWNNYRENGLLLMKDDHPVPMLHLLEKQMAFKNITDEDFSILFNGKKREKNDAYIYEIKVIKQNITCKNGYIHQLEDVLIPPSNMAEVIRTIPETTVFSSLLERFSAPYYSNAMTNEYNRLYGTNDSIFVKGYFSERSGSGARIRDPQGNLLAGYLSFDPGWNTYTYNATSSSEMDMAAMFVPDNNTINTYFKEGSGRFLYDRYDGKWENIPADVLDDLLNNHLKSSFVNSVPSKFDEIMNDAKDPMGVKKEDIIKTYLTANGVVYITNKIYPPASYVAVSAPALISENMRIFNWAIKDLEYYAYLLSMDSYYSFLIPTDDALKYYYDPVSFAKDQPEVFEFKYDAGKNTVTAKVSAYNIATGAIGDSIRVATIAEVRDRLDDLLDYHIIVGNIEDGKSYYRAKNGGTIKVSGKGTNMQISSGFQIDNNQSARVETIYDQTVEGNGKAYIMNAPVLAPTKSVYNTFGTDFCRDSFSEFFALLEGNDEATYAEHELYDIFYLDKSNVGMDYNVKFFSTYHYTIYVPTNEAVQRAIANGLPTWEQIKAQGDAEVRKAMTEKLVRFLRYHFQDNSLYIDGSSLAAKAYETAALNEQSKRFYTLTVSSSENNMKVIDGAGNTRNVITGGGLYNIMARDYKFNSNDPKKATAIETSAFAVIHQIDDVLYYEKDQFK